MSLPRVMIGVLGGINAYWLTYISPLDVFDVTHTIHMIIMALFGGIGTVFGPVIGAVVLSLANEIIGARLTLYVPPHARRYPPCRGHMRAARPHRTAPSREAPKMSLLSVRGLKKSFGAVKALNDVSFDVEEGEILGIIGPNGAGKTTLFNVIVGLTQARRRRRALPGQEHQRPPAPPDMPGRRSRRRRRSSIPSSRLR